MLLFKSVQRSLYVLGVVGFAAALCVYVLIVSPTTSKTALALTAANAEGDYKDKDLVDVGGVMRRKTDVQKVKSKIAQERETDQIRKGAEEIQRIGLQPAVPIDGDETRQKLSDQFNKGGENLFELHVEAPKFVLEDFNKNQKEYLNTFAPNRVYQAAQPGEGVVVLAPLKQGSFNMLAGESVRLQVQSAAGYPVTFVSLDLGTFENNLNAITVLADSEGVAEAEYIATPGTINGSYVMVGSPGASGQVVFEMRILLPENGVPPAK